MPDDLPDLRPDVLGDTYVTASEAAALAGVQLDTFTSYVSREQAPAPVATLLGNRLYLRTDVTAWLEGRRGRGWRKGTAGA